MRCVQGKPDVPSGMDTRPPQSTLSPTPLSSTSLAPKKACLVVAGHLLGGVDAAGEVDGRRRPVENIAPVVVSLQEQSRVPSQPEVAPALRFAEALVSVVGVLRFQLMGSRGRGNLRRDHALGPNTIWSAEGKNGGIGPTARIVPERRRVRSGCPRSGDPSCSGRRVRDPQIASSPAGDSGWGFRRTDGCSS